MMLSFEDDDDETLDRCLFESGMDNFDPLSFLETSGCDWNC